MKVDGKPIDLLVTDIDNTMFDWVAYYVTAFSGMLNRVAQIIHSDYETLSNEAKIILTEHTIEYPFVVQQLPSVNAFYGHDIEKMLVECVTPARDYFKELAKDFLKPYPTVIEALTEIRARYPELAIVALTDAPRYVAMWKLNKLGLLHFFNAVYGLGDPIIPTDQDINKVKVTPDILMKHLRQNNFGFKGKIRILPHEYEKPGTRGLKTVLMDYAIDENKDKRGKVLWVGDNLLKDVFLGHSLGVKTAWAAYGTKYDPDLKEILKSFGPPASVQQSAINLEEEAKKIKPDIVLDNFGDIMQHLST